VKNGGPVFILVTNLALSLGGPLAVSVFLVVLSVVGKNGLYIVWRVCFGFGALLPMTVFYFRLRMLTSRLYYNGAIKFRVPYILALKRYWGALIGTAGAWFIYDFITFPNGIFSATIISTVIDHGDIKQIAEWQLLLGAIALPGIFIGAMLCNRLGRRRTMMLGFGGYVIFGLVIGLNYDIITKIIPLFVISFGAMQSIGNMGPGDMLGLVSAESYPTAIRGTCYGFSAAVGKLGAVLGTQAFLPLQRDLGRKWIFIVSAICGIIGILITYFLVPDMSGVDLEEEDRASSYSTLSTTAGEARSESTSASMSPIEKTMHETPVPVVAAVVI